MLRGHASRCLLLEQLSVVSKQSSVARALPGLAFGGAGFGVIVAAFGGVISEVGAVMLVGGNIDGKTRVLTTAIVLNTRTGDFTLALALGVILLTLAFLANVAMLRLQSFSNGK